ncbi:MAG: CHAT domain-containing protein [Bacteroidota bacterium]
MKLVFIGFLVCCSSLFSQNNFSSITTNERLTDTQKDQEFEALLQRYTAENKIDSLLKETYEVIKWNYEVGRLKKAIALNQKNLVLMDSINYDDSIFYRRNIYSLGFYQNKDGKTKDALQSLKRLINYQEADEFALKSSNIIAEIYSAEGDNYNSLTYFKLYRQLSQKFKDDTRLALASLGIARSCLQINSKKSLSEAIEISTATLNHLESSPQANVHSYYYLLLYKSLGNLHSDRRDYNFEVATQYFDKALEIALKNNDYEEVSKINNDIGLIYLKDKRPEAKLFFEKGLAYKSNQVILCIIYRNLAQFYLDQKEFGEALQYIQKSLDVITFKNSQDVTDLPAKEDLINLKSKNQIIESLSRKAEIWLRLAKSKADKKDEYEQALRSIKLADWLIDVAKRSSEYQSKLFWRKTGSALYLKGVEVAYESKQAEDAFYFMEKNKALQLLEDVNLKSARANTQIPVLISQREQALKAKIIDLENRDTSSKLEETNRDLIIAKNNYGRFIDSLAPDIKFLYKLEKPAEVISIDSIKSKYLQADKVYIEYMLDEEDGFGLVISNERIKLFKIDDIEELKKLAIAYRNYVNKPLSDKQSLAGYTHTAYNLYKFLFPDEIQEFIKGRELSIIPDYFLQNIPFEALLTIENDSKSYLISQHQINYAYSLTFLIENKKLKKSNKNRIVAYAPVNFKDELATLPNTKTELDAIDQITSMDAFLYEEATKPNFFTSSKDAKIIHIASHADASDNISPWISFYDEKLNLNELYNHSTAADLVILSACNTSLGEVYKGEGVMSLSRGFFNSGSQSVLTTLWEINDKSSMQVINAYYENLDEGQNKSLALHNAKLTYLNQASLTEASPYYWASFILIGDTGKIDLPNNHTYLYYLIALFALIILGYIFFFKKK